MLDDLTKLESEIQTADQVSNEFKNTIKKLVQQDAQLESDSDLTQNLQYVQNIKNLQYVQNIKNTSEILTKQANDILNYQPIKPLDDLKTALTKLQAIDLKIDDLIGLIKTLPNIQKDIVIDMDKIQKGIKSKILTTASRPIASIGPLMTAAGQTVGSAMSKISATAGSAVTSATGRAGSAVESSAFWGKELTKNDKDFINAVRQVKLDSLSKSFKSTLKSSLIKLNKELNENNHDQIGKLLNELLNQLVDANIQSLNTLAGTEVPQRVDNQELQQMHENFNTLKAKAGEAVTQIEDQKNKIDSIVENLTSQAKNLTKLTMDCKIALYELDKNIPKDNRNQNQQKVHKFLTNYYTPEQFAFEYWTYAAQSVVGLKLVLFSAASLCIYIALILISTGLLTSGLIVLPIILMSAGALFGVIPAALSIMMINIRDQNIGNFQDKISVEINRRGQAGAQGGSTGTSDEPPSNPDPTTQSQN